ncbi:NADPH-dependent FMN reductase [Streptomyces sp. NBC_00582]|uniref:NADPH-dependent FMN reductase n=1 Tax=Streptomyces sp. NBC_00582 TaxID=2975783 RepID=UPI002E814139|nr:NADPH-dependent FMN reductase [Streptomyces sp. NBC_00582]WUB67477.1 NAD(P)H-dependent oxidoreductase [Streptomyces sp. NBC_00582]
MPTLHVVVGSTRPGRLALPIAQWAAQAAEQHGGFDVQLVDLAEFGLPLLDEPAHPRTGQYAHEHTRAWSATVDEADAFVFVTPEYNFGPPAALLNAISYLHREWLCKPAAFVSYGGVAAGLRSVQVLKQVLTTLKVMPIPEGVAIPFVFQLVQDGSFQPTPPLEAAATDMLDELLRWTEPLQLLRKGLVPAQ